MINNKQSLIRILFISLIIIYLGMFSSFLCDAQKNKQKLTTQNQAPSAAVPLLVRGKVADNMKGYPGITVHLDILTKAKVKPAGNIHKSQTKTDKNGNYSFTLDYKLKGQQFVVYPFHPAVEAFNPARQYFVLNDNTVINFQFSAPTLRIIGLFNYYPLGGFNGAEVSLDQAIGFGKFKNVHKGITHSGGYIDFSLNFGNYGKVMRMRAKNPQLSSWGQGFTPQYKIFPVKKKQQLKFEYNGPLPDLIMASISQPRPGLLRLEVKNQGNMDAGPFQVKISYKYWNGKKQKFGYPAYREGSIGGLAKGQTKYKEWDIGVLSGDHIEWHSVMVDYKNEVVESNEKNNSTEW